MYQLILWDVDGTLLDFDASERQALGDTFVRYGYDFDEAALDAFHQINDTLWKCYERGEMTKSQVIFLRFRQLFAQLGVREAMVDQFASDYQQRMAQMAVLLPGALETVQALHGRVRQCVVTNGSTITQLPRLKQAGLDQYMEHIFISEQLGAPKPTTAFFDGVFAALKPPVERCQSLIVGDSLTSDIQGGLNAGVDTCWIRPEGADTHLPVKYRITGPEEVMKIVGQ